MPAAIRKTAFSRWSRSTKLPPRLPKQLSQRPQRIRRMFTAWSAKSAQWWALHKKQLLLWRAKGEAEGGIAALSSQHDALDSQLQTAKSKAGASADGGALAPAARLAWHDNDAAMIVQSTKDRAVLQKKVADFDKRIDDHKELSAIYSQWIGVVAAKQRSV